MYAVIQTGGKQYRVEEGQRLDVEKLNGDEVSLRPAVEMPSSVFRGAISATG